MSIIVRPMSSVASAGTIENYSFIVEKKPSYKEFKEELYNELFKIKEFKLSVISKIIDMGIELTPENYINNSSTWNTRTCLHLITEKINIKFPAYYDNISSNEENYDIKRPNLTKSKYSKSFWAPEKLEAYNRGIIDKHGDWIVKNNN